MKLFIDYDSELCVLVLADLRRRLAEREAKHESGRSLFAKLSYNILSNGCCAILTDVSGDTRLVVTPCTRHVMVALYWKPKPNEAPNSRPGWSIGPCTHTSYVARPPIEACEAFLDKLWADVQEHFSLSETPA